MRKLYVFVCGGMYYSKEGRWSARREDALVVDDWAVEFYMEGKFSGIASMVKLVEVEHA